MKKTLFRKVLALIMVLCLVPTWGIAAWAAEGDPVTSTDADPQPVTAEYVDANVNVPSVIGAIAAPINPGGSAELEVSGPVDVVNTGGVATGVMAAAQQIGSDASVSAESVSAESASSGSDSATGVVALAQSPGPAEASVEVSGPVEASSAGDSLTVGIDAHAESPADSEVTASVSAGDVTATSTGDADTIGVYTITPPGSNANSSADATVAGNVVVTSEGDGFAAGVYAYNNGEGSSEITVSGTVTADSNGSDPENSYAIGVATSDFRGGTSTLETGNVEATSTGAGSAYGVFVHAFDEGSHSEITVGDVGAEVTGSDYPAAEGIHVNTGNSGEAVINAQNVEAEAEGSGTATGIYATASSDGNTTVTAAEKVEAEAENNLATGIDVTAKGGTVTVNAGEVDSESEHGGAYGINLNADGANTSGTVDVSGPVTVTGEEYAYGASISAFNGSTASVNTSEITVSSDPGRAFGVDLNTEGANSSATVDVSGPITVTGEEYAYGARIYALNGSTAVLNVTAAEDSEEDEALIKAKSDNGAIGIEISSYSDGTVDVTVEGNIESDGVGIYSDSSSSTHLIDVDVIGDINAAEVGIAVNGDGKTSFVIDGTVHGDDIGIELQSVTTIDNLDITVWKIDTTKIGSEDHVAAEKDETFTATETSKEVEENIHYIIKIEPSQEDIISVDGATEHEGYKYTAKQGETVAVKVSVPSGYQLTGAYGYDGGKLPLKMDPNTGNYYVLMPMGGGVLLRAKLDPIFSGGSGSSDSGYEYVYTSYTSGIQYATVKFDFNGGHDIRGHVGPIIKTVPVGTWLRLLEAPKKDGSVFELWHTDDPTVKACMPFDSFCVTGDITFITKWVGEELPYQPTEEDKILVNSLVSTALLPVTERSVEEPAPVISDTSAAIDPLSAAGSSVAEETVPEITTSPAEDAALPTAAADQNVAEAAPSVEDTEVDAATMIGAMTTLTAATEALQAATEALIASISAQAETSGAAKESDLPTEEPASDETDSVKAEEADGEESLDENANAESQPADEKASTSMDEAREELQRITEEINSAKSELKATTEELNAAKAELKATTEELNAAKEELRATMDELTEAKDALHNGAEELTAAREEFRLLLEELKSQVASSAEGEDEAAASVEPEETDTHADEPEVMNGKETTDSSVSPVEEKNNP